MPLPEFQPETCAVVVDIEARSLRPIFPEEALLHAVAWAVPIDEKGEPRSDQAYGSLDWTQVGYGAAVDAGCSSFEVAARHVDLRALHEAMFDQRGRLRDELGISGRSDRDLLLIDRMDVAEGQDFEDVASELLDHVLAHYTSGCFGAAYIDDPEPKPLVREILLDYGFQWHQQEGWGFFLLDLGLLRRQNRKHAQSDPWVQ